MIAVLDTNVLVSGLINPHGPPGRLVDMLRSGALDVAVDDRILAEYDDVLRRPHLSAYFTKSDADQIMEFLRGNSLSVLVTGHVSDLPDRDDAPFLEVAIAAGVPLITGNIKHYPKASIRDCRVMTPSEFLAGLAL